MRAYSELLAELHSRIGNDTDHDNIFRQASDAIEQLLSRQDEFPIELPLLSEPSDHEAEGAMLYVMSRGRSVA